GLLDGVALRGGYAGCGEPDPDLWDVDSNATILSGDLSGDDEPDFTNNGENSYHVLTSTDVGSNAVLDGFTITGGNANGPWQDGYREGGGMYNYWDSSPTVTNCTFSGNSADYHGGGMCNDFYSSPTVTNCTFSGNSADDDGGGMYNYGSSPTVTNCTFSGNSASWRGGGMYNYWSSPAVTNCIFSGNSADDDGGGMRNSGGSPTVTNCTFSGNSADDDGGGMYNYDSSPTVANCTFNGNSAGCGGGMSTYYNSSPTVTNCIFSGNSADLGGGMFNGDYSSLTVTNCTFSGNLAGFCGGGMFNGDYNNLTVTNCILWGNVPDEIHEISYSEATVTYSDVQGSWLGDGNIDAAPLFVRDPDPGPDGHWDGVDDDFGDLRLAGSSPCLDAGTNATEPPLPATDLEGNPRIINGIVDMGAYEGPNQAFLVVGAPVLVPEGAGATFTVALVCDPGGTVDVSIEYDTGDEDITMELGPWTFDSTNYWIPQDVALTCVEDTDQIEGLTRFRISANGVADGFVMAREIENDGSAVLFVDATATGANDGSCWADAFNELRDALSTAAAASVVEEIRVATGRYTPAEPGGERSATFRLIDGVAVYGGFPAGGGPWEQRDVNSNATILSGDLDGDDEPDFINNDENSYHVLTSTDVGFNATLDGFTITGGNADGGGGDSFGSGMCNLGSSPTVINCTFSGNSAYYTGGVMYNWCNSNPTVTNCTFSGNSAGNCGGGMCNGDHSSPTVTNCIFSGNSADNSGGGMYNWWNSSPTVTNCTFSGNSADYAGGGTYNDLYSNPTVTNCTFSRNSADHRGGGMYNYDSNPTVTNCILWGNVPDEIHEIYDSEATVTYSDVQGGWLGEGNISVDPLFVDADGPDGIAGTMDDDLRLLPESPCIDAGNNYAVPADNADLDGDGNTAERIPLDLDAAPRFVDDPATDDTGVPDPPDYVRIVDMGAYEFQVSAQLLGTVPSHEDSLCRVAGNVIVLTFADDIEAPEPGDILIQELWADGAYGPDMSTSGFSFTVEDDADSYPRVLVIIEEGTVLSNKTWIAVRNIGGWAGVRSFTIQYMVQVGDVNNDGRVMANDLSPIFPMIPTAGASPTERCDINGDGRVMANDLSPVFPNIPSPPVPKPSGH
ncbi:MAG: hypothetical protein KAV82_07010, partial [Phycisphaerae bacterium]|nr:hypothetical protein [Phycisphaerae bacterium]